MTTAKSKYIRYDIIRVVGVCLTLIGLFSSLAVGFINWTRSDSARAQQLTDLEVEVHALSKKENANTNSLDNRLDALQNKLDEILNSLATRNSKS